mgnify:CR=1 FL=1
MYVQDYFLHGAGRYGLQCLANLDQLPPKGAVLIATPIDLGKLMTINKPSTRVRYELEEQDLTVLPRMIREAVSRHATLSGKEALAHAGH